MQTCTAMQRTAEPILLVGGLGIWQSFTSRSSEKLYTTGTSYPHTCIARYLLPTCKFSPVTYDDIMCRDPNEYRQQHVNFRSPLFLLLLPQYTGMDWKQVSFIAWRCIYNEPITLVYIAADCGPVTGSHL